MALQVGEFYETMGTDAVMLVQHAGLNPMASGSPPRAGCPIVNLRRTLYDLVEQAGLSVVSILLLHLIRHLHHKQLHFIHSRCMLDRLSRPI